MKHQKLAIITALCVLITFFFACSRHSPDVPKQTPVGAFAKLVQDEEAKNYCKGCGSSQDDAFHCDDHRSCVASSGCLISDATNEEAEPTGPQMNNINEAYEIRDSFLVYYDSIGQNYITYYYELSHIANDQGLITSANYLDWLGFGAELIAAANMIRFGSVTDVPIDNTLKAKAMYYVNLFRNNTDNEYIQSHLDQIENDLDEITNANVAYIRAKLEE